MSSPRRLRAVAVYCGSNVGADPAFAAAAAELGTLLARRGIRLVYGGGQVGLMGVVAEASRREGGQITGVITSALVAKEVADAALDDLRVVGTMHERKAAMSDAADAFIMLPGGYGTFDEFFEAVSWTQLGIHDKPCGALDVDGYYAPLCALLDGAARQGFVSEIHRELVLTDDDPARLLDRLAAWTPVTRNKWLDRSER